MDQLLTTKLFIPVTQPELVPRPRLIEKLYDGLHHKLTLISAPAGYGKTTLASEWAISLQASRTKEDRPEKKVAWLSLDPSDNDPVRFLIYLIAALQKVDPDICGAAQAMMGSTQPPPAETVLTSLINDLADSSQAFILILDDYHLIETLPIHQQLGFLVEHQPPEMHLLLLTREDPPLPLARMRARGQMVEIRQEDLRFSLEECAQFLQQVMEFEISSADIAALEDRTEGWIAGLQLAALSMKGSDDISGFVQAFMGSSRFIFDYLIEDVFSQQPDEVQDFLLKTSILDRLYAPLCEAVCGRADSREILNGLEQANLFVVPLDQSRSWYRYNHFFAELLHHQLQLSREYSESSLHTRASQWYEANDFMAEAVQHALAAENWEAAERVITRATPDMVQNGQLATLNSWVEALPDWLVRGSLELATTKGWISLMTGQFETAGTFAELAEGLLSPNSPTDERAPLTALRASLALAQQDLANSIELSQETLELLETNDDFFLRGMALNNLAQAHLLVGDLPAAIQIYRQMVSQGQQIGASPTTISAMGNLAALLHQGGKRREAVILCQQALDQCVDRQGRQLPLAGYIHVSMGMLYYEANDLEAARHHLLKGIAFGEQLGVTTGVTTSSGVTLAQLQQALGKEGAALETIAEIRQVASQFNLDYADILAAGVEADILLKQGNVTAAERWAETTGFAPTDMPNPMQEGNYLIYARLLLAQNKLEEVEILLTNFKQFADKGGRFRSLITISILKALALQAGDRRKEALTYLETALKIAAPEGYRRAFLDEGQPVIELLPLVRHNAPDFVDQLLEEARFAPGLKIPTPQIQPLVEPLSRRELEILQLVGDGLSNQEIADRLILSVGTVKAHLHNIYGKLEVRGRTQAISRAREIELL